MRQEVRVAAFCSLDLGEKNTKGKGLCFKDGQEKLSIFYKKDNRLKN
jgi:hypothetical protein